LFEQPTGRGGRGRGLATSATTSAPATTNASRVLSVIPEKMAQYDQVVEKYKLKKLP